jgi:PIN domain-containing protein
MDDAAAHPDFDGIYLDTNVLIAEGWPAPSIVLNNLLRYAAWWHIARLLPEPVLAEAEDHWLRGVKDGISRLSAASRELQRVAGPITCEVTTNHSPADKLLEEYRSRVSAAVKDYEITRTPLTRRSLQQIFALATKYAPPFAHKGEGKGFQDVVILTSILDDLNADPEARAIFITADEAFKDVRFSDLLPGFDPDRLRIVSKVETAFDSLWRPYFDETVIKPYRQEVENAQHAAKALTPEITEFVKSRLTEDMLRPGIFDKIVKILSVDSVSVFLVDSPIPKEGALNRLADIAIKISAECTVLVKRVFWLGAEEGGTSLLPSQELEQKISWEGTVLATAEIVDTQFRNIRLKSLASRKD